MIRKCGDLQHALSLKYFSDFLDDDGIWREDDEKENFDHYTFRTDSGIGTTGRRSTTSINKVFIGAGRHGGSVNLQEYDDSFEDHQHDSFALGEKSFNISDLEASASVVDDFDFDGASLDSNQDGRLSKTRRNLSQNRNEQYIQKGYLDDSEVFDASFSDRSSGEFESPRVPQRSHNRRDDVKQNLSKNSYEDLYRPRNYSDDDGRESRHFSDWSRREDSRDIRPGDQRYSQSRNSQSLADYLLSGGDNISNRSTNQSGSQYDERGQQIYGRPKVVGDSIFTQEEEQVVHSFHQQRSLMEFERLEAALDFDGKSEKSADQMDLIGAYLQGLQEQEETEEDMGTRELVGNEGGSDYNVKQRRSERPASAEGNPTEEHYQSRQFNGSVESSSVEQVKDAKSSERRRNEFKSNKQKNQSNYGSYQSSKQNSRDQPTLTCNDSSENWNTSLVYDESVSLLENQPPPFDSMSFSTLDMTGGTNESPSRNATLSETSNTRQSKIPMLRSRSPSMSRPASPSRARSTSPGTSQRRSQERGRALPPTPRQSRRVTSPNSPKGQDMKPATNRRSKGSNDNSRQASIERDLSEEDKKLDEAANILLDATETKETYIFSTGSTGKGSRPGSANTTKGKRNSFSRIKASSEEALKAATRRDTLMQRSGSENICRTPMKAEKDASKTMGQVSQRTFLYRFRNIMFV